MELKKSRMTILTIGMSDDHTCNYRALSAQQKLSIRKFREGFQKKVWKLGFCTNFLDHFGKNNLGLHAWVTCFQMLPKAFTCPKSCVIYSGECTSWGSWWIIFLPCDAPGDGVQSMLKRRCYRYHFIINHYIYITCFEACIISLEGFKIVC